MKGIKRFGGVGQNDTPCLTKIIFIRLCAFDKLAALKLYYFCFVEDGASPCTPGCPRTCSTNQGDLQLRDPLASVSQALDLDLCATIA